MDYKQKLDDLISAAAQSGASDLHISAGHYPSIRVDGQLINVSNQNILDTETTSGLVFALLGDKKDRFILEKELDFFYYFQNFPRDLSLSSVRTATANQRHWPE